MVTKDCLMCGEVGNGRHPRVYCRVFCRACWHAVLQASRNHHTCRKDALGALFVTYWAEWERSGAATLWRTKVLSEYGSTDTTQRRAA